MMNPNNGDNSYPLAPSCSNFVLCILLVVYLITLLAAQAIQAPNRVRLVNNELESMWKEEVTDPSCTLWQNLSEATKEKSNQTPPKLQARCSTA